MPLPLATHLVQIASVAEDEILDPFGGVGTVGVAATQLNRKFIGFETDGVRFAAGKEHLPATSKWFNCSLDEFDTSDLSADALITSPPYGWKEGSSRVFDALYFEKMETIFRVSSDIIRPNGIAIIELMNWPEFSDGHDLLFRFHKFMEQSWFYVREIVFMNANDTEISQIASHTWLTVWIKK